ncbi:MAG: hypothetical protein ABI402_20280 [Ferruginibacter sp.]
MKLKLNYKAIMMISIIMFFMSNIAMAQEPPAGKYNTTNYPEDRKAIEALSMVDNSTVYLNDDYIAIGPEGRVSYGYAAWKKGFTDKGATFKSVTPRPGTYILRVYNGDAAVKNMILDVVFATPGGDMSITVIRTETYIKQNGKWYFVGGQGTKLPTKEELEAMGKKTMKNN